MRGNRLPGITCEFKSRNGRDRYSSRISCLTCDYIHTLRRRLGDAGRERAREVFSLDRHVGEITGLYEEVLRGHG